MSVLEQFQFSNSMIDCRQSSYGAGAALQRHYHDSTWVVLAFSGSFSVTMRAREANFTPKSLFYLPAGEMHANVFGSRGAGVFITAVDPVWIGNRLDVANAEADRPRIAPPGYLRGLVLKMYEEFKSPDALSDLIVEGAFLELLGRWFRGAPINPTTLRHGCAGSRPCYRIRFEKRFHWTMPRKLREFIRRILLGNFIASMA